MQSGELVRTPCGSPSYSAPEVILCQGAYNAGVAVALIDGRIAAQKIVVALSIYIPQVHALAPLQHYRQWVVVVGAMGLFQIEIILGFGR